MTIRSPWGGAVAHGSTLAIAMLILANAAFAQTKTAEPVEPQSLAERYVDARNGLTLADAVARAIEGEPSLRAARTEQDAARAMRTQAVLRPNPSLSLERRQEPAGTDNQTMIQVEWPLDLFRRSGRIAVADREIEATEQSIADRTRTLVADVRMRYGQAAAAVRDLAVADSVAASARRELGLLRQRVTEGATPPLEGDLMEVEVRRFEAERLLAAGRTEAAMFELKRIVGLSADTPIRLHDTLDALGARADLPPLDTDVASGRADVREAEARVQVADARIGRARDEGRFDVSLFGSYVRMDAGFPQRGFSEQGPLERIHGVFHYLAGGALVTVPWRNRNQGDVAAAQAERAGAAARLEAVQLSAQAEIAAAAAQEVHARQALALIEDGVRLARRNLDVVRQTYELGRTPIFDVLAEQRRYLDVERTYTEILRAAFEARTALQRARGEL
jgi:outer membrane protein, heavy metal efflux system